MPIFSMWEFVFFFKAPLIAVPTGNVAFVCLASYLEHTVLSVYGSGRVCCGGPAGGRRRSSGRGVSEGDGPLPFPLVVPCCLALSLTRTPPLLCFSPSLTCQKAGRPGGTEERKAALRLPMFFPCVQSLSKLNLKIFLHLAYPRCCRLSVISGVSAEECVH